MYGYSRLYLLRGHRSHGHPPFNEPQLVQVLRMLKTWTPWNNLAPFSSSSTDFTSHVTCIGNLAKRAQHSKWPTGSQKVQYAAGFNSLLQPEENHSYTYNSLMKTTQQHAANCTIVRAWAHITNFDVMNATTPLRWIKQKMLTTCTRCVRKRHHWCWRKDATIRLRAE